MERESAVPDAEELERVAEVVARLVDSGIDEPAPTSIPATRYPTSASRSRSVIATSPRRIRRRASRWPTTYPTRYITPYQRIANGPTRTSSGGIRG